MMKTMERFTVGSDLTYAIEGVEQLSSRQRRRNKTLAEPIHERYGTSISTETARTIDNLSNAVDPVSLIRASQSAGLHDVEDWESKIPEETLSELNTEEPGISDALSLLDRKLTESLCPRDKDASEVTSRTNRESVYIPELVGEGTVYMAKTLSSAGKLRIAWDLDDDNQVVVVDDYDIWESLLGWQKLKNFPHGKNEIQEQYGDKLSDDVLEVLVGSCDGDTETKSSNNDKSSRGRRTRTKPSEEVLNLALSRRHKKRQRWRSKDIADAFESDDSVEIGYGDAADMLILFPKTSDKLLSEHWWVAGKKPFGDGGVAVANCNKGTFEYLNQYEQVWHIEDYLSESGNYEFSTTAGPVTMNTVASNNLVVHILTEQTQESFMRPKVFQNMTDSIHRYCDNQLYRPPPLPHEEDMVYAPITKTDVFWLRPELQKHTEPEDGDALIITGSTSSRDIPVRKSLSSDYKLYSRARLNNWDFHSEELSTLDEAYIKLDDGGFEIVETLAKVHDAGGSPFTATPQQRWSNK